MIHIGRGTTNLGAFSEDEVREGLRTGRFVMSDLGWREGMAGWKPLSEFPDLTAAPPPIPVPGALNEPAIEPQYAPGSPLPPTVEAGLPWDERDSRGFVTTYVETVKLVLTEPAEAFARMRTSGGFGSPLMYAIIGGWLGIIAVNAYALAMPGNSSIFPIHDARFAAWQTTSFTHLFLLMGMIFAPVSVTIAVFISSLFLHLFLFLVGGANRSLEATFRVVCFTAGSTSILHIVPFCGFWIGLVWRIVCIVIGFSKVHGISTMRALVAVLLPYIVCCGGGFLAGFAYVFLSHHPG